MVVPLAAAVSFLGGSQAPSFTIIGSIWLMVLDGNYLREPRVATGARC